MGISRCVGNAYFVSWCVVDSPPFSWGTACSLYRRKPKNPYKIYAVWYSQTSNSKTLFSHVTSDMANYNQLLIIIKDKISDDINSKLSYPERVITLGNMILSFGFTILFAVGTCVIRNPNITLVCLEVKLWLIVCGLTNVADNYPGSMFTINTIKFTI